MMQKITDVFIQRPVLATVISLFIFAIGLRAIFNLPVREFPRLDNALITVTTAYPGADAALIEGFITTPIERQVTSADGIDYITSSSTDGVSQISIYLKSNFDPNVAFTSIASKVAEVKQQLPQEAEDPIVQKATGRGTALMYIGFSSTVLSREQIADYLSRVLQPKLETVTGVAEAQLLGAPSYAMRIWLDSVRMAALGVTPNDIMNTLQNNNVQSAAGSTEGAYVAITVNAQTDLQRLQHFNELIIKQEGGRLVRLQDVAKVQLGAESYNSSVIFNGERGVFIAITATPAANPLTVIHAIKQQLPQWVAQFPPALKANIVYDVTEYIRAAIKEVILTILEAALIVTAVIFLFLGSLRTILVPIVTIPLSLVGVFSVMLGLGYSINLLTLLSLVLAIGMVVDDAIVVLENIYRHVEAGLSAREAALQGAREIATPIIAMTITLAAVYAPIGLLTGMTGSLFREFAFTLAATVLISGVVALSLSPMMCSQLLSRNLRKQPLVHRLDQFFLRLNTTYKRALTGCLADRPLVILFAAVVLLSCLFLFMTSKREMAPLEDQGFVFVMGTGPQSATLEYMTQFTRELDRIYRHFTSGKDYFVLNGVEAPNTMISGFILKPWGERKVDQLTLNKKLQEQLNQITGIQIQSFPLPALPVGGGGAPIDFQLTTTQPFSELYAVMQRIVDRAQQSGLFMYLSGSLRYNKPTLQLHINRNQAAQMGISMRDIANALRGSLGEAHVTRFNWQGRSYEVIPQLQQSFRDNPDTLNRIHLKTATGSMIPLSTIVSMSYENQPDALTHFQQLHAVSLSGMMLPGYTLDQGLHYLQHLADQELPQGFSTDYGGQSRQFIQESGTLLYTFAFSLIVIFLVLAAQFESFKDPLVVMTSVPMAVCGALLPINWGLATLNIYTQIGLITLVGLISKHGILMVNFAKQLRREQPTLSLQSAIIEAAGIRLRPILMTTASMVLGVLPLLLSTGAGAHSRFDMGLVIASGMSVGTLFTLFVLPVMYTLTARAIILFLLAVGAAGGLLYSMSLLF